MCISFKLNNFVTCRSDSISITIRQWRDDVGEERKMRLPFLIVFSTCLLSSFRVLGHNSNDGAPDGADINRAVRSFQANSRNRQLGQVHEVTDDSDERRRTRLGLADDGSSPHSDSASDRLTSGNDDGASRGRVRVLSAGFRRYDTSDLRPLKDPGITDDVLNRFDDNGIENQLQALAVEFRQGGGDTDKYDGEEENNYEGLGFGDTDHRLGGSDDHIGGDVLLGPPWMEWGHCNITCGLGQQSRWRSCRPETMQACNRVTGREVEWRRCLGMECDRETIEKLGGGCKDEFIMTLLLGLLLGVGVCIVLTLIGSCFYSWCKQPSWKLSDLCPAWCGPNPCSSDCCQGCCDTSPGSPAATWCYGCGGGLCCCCQPCCDPNFQDNMYYQKQMRENQAYRQHHFRGDYNRGARGSARNKRPPAPLPREASMQKRKMYDEPEPEYAEIDQFYRDSPRKSPQKSSPRKTRPKENYYSPEAKMNKGPSRQVENDYLEILADDDVDDYMVPRRRDEQYISDFEYLDEPPPRPR